MIKHRDVIKFIKTIRESFIGSADVYTRGSCYHFYEILRIAFIDVEPYYYSKHIISKINNRFYDITGEIKDKTLSRRKFKKYTGQHELHKCKFDMYKQLEKYKEIISDSK
jgi:hypothetical protein